jgi:hypothetical protein
VQPTGEVAVGRGRGAARAQLAGAVARPLRGVGGCGRPGPWLGCCVARPTRAPDHGRSWPVAKPSTKVLNAKEKHKFVCSVVVRVV